MPETLLACRQENKRSKLDDISDIVEVGQQVMSFGSFYSSKILGSHLTLTNKTDHEHTIEIAVDRSGQIDTQEILAPYATSDLPFKPQTSTMDNTEVIHQCVFIENPKTKTLEKSIVFKLTSKAQKQFVVVIKAPRAKQLDVLSLLTITRKQDRKVRTEKQICE